MRQWSRYFDWLLVLSPEDETEMVARLQKEKPVPYVTSWEKMGFVRGTEEATTREGLNTIETVLDVRFGSAAQTLREDIRKKVDTDELQKLIDASKTVASLDAFRALLK